MHYEIWKDYQCTSKVRAKVLPNLMVACHGLHVGVPGPLSRLKTPAGLHVKLLGKLLQVHWGTVLPSSIDERRSSSLACA